MKIHYLRCLDGKKLFSFHRHDYKEYFDKKGRYYMIDGGFDYCKCSYPGQITRKKSLVEEAEISEVIEDIREQFKWTKQLDKNNKPLKKPKTALLKELTTDHILGILKYLVEHLNSNVDQTWKVKYMIFNEELLYRSKKKLL